MEEAGEEEEEEAAGEEVPVAQARWPPGLGVCSDGGRVFFFF